MKFKKFFIFAQKCAFTGHQATIAGNLLVYSSGNLVLNARYNEGQPDSADTGTSDNYEAGTDDIVGNVTFVSGSNIQLEGSIKVKKSTLVVEDGANLNALSAANDDSSGAIIISDEDDNNADERSTLRISSTTLGKFLSSGDSYNAITKRDTSYELVDTTSTDMLGSLVLQSGGVVTFTDNVDLSDFKFASGNTADQAVAAGAITIGPDGGEVRGDNVTVSQALKTTGGTNLGSSNLEIKVSNLTLGDGTASGFQQLSDAGFKSFIAHDNLTVNVANDGYFKIDSTAKNQLKNTDSTHTG